MTGTSLLDSALFDLNHIDRDMAECNERIRRATLEAPARWEHDLAVERAAGSHAAGILPAVEPVVEAEMRTIPGPGGDVSLRLIGPRTGKVEGVYLHFHGGGFTYGSAGGQDHMLREIADAARAICISVEYRLAPEHPFPAGPADCETACWWVVRNGCNEFGTDRLVLGGESAGATLSVLTALRLRDRRNFTDIAGLNLSYGGYDFSLTPSMRAGRGALIVPLESLERMLRGYLGGHPADDPAVSPLYAKLDRLPRALFNVGTLDPLLDDTLFMHARWLAAGNQAELNVITGGLHGFNLLPVEAGRQTNRRIEAFIRSCFRAEQGT
jgi:acetyl esterase